jgi:hypothetical protein
MWCQSTDALGSARAIFNVKKERKGDARMRSTDTEKVTDELAAGIKQMNMVGVSVLLWLN